jgi:hypothetical protein
MTDQASYDEAYAVFVHLSDRVVELSDEQHVCVMEAFNCLTDPDLYTDLVPPTTLPTPTNAQADGPVVGAVDGPVDGPMERSVAQVLAAAAAALARLIEVTEDGALALSYARAHALLIAALAAE